MVFLSYCNIESQDKKSFMPLSKPNNFDFRLLQNVLNCTSFDCILINGFVSNAMQGDSFTEKKFVQNLQNIRCISIFSNHALKFLNGSF